MEKILIVEDIKRSPSWSGTIWKATDMRPPGWRMEPRLSRN